MITVTEAAKLILRGILDNALRQHPDLVADGVPEPGLRLLVEDDGASFALDYPQVGDQVIIEDGKSILIVGPEVSEVLGDSTIDIIHSPEGDQLSVQRQVSGNGHTKEAA